MHARARTHNRLVHHTVCVQADIASEMCVFQQLHGLESSRMFEGGGEWLPLVDDGASNVFVDDITSNVFVEQRHITSNVFVEQGPTPSELLGFSIAEV